MPFESEAQRRFMFAQHPRIAKRWAKETPKGKDLPEKKTDSDPEETKKKAFSVQNSIVNLQHSMNNSTNYNNSLVRELGFQLGFMKSAGLKDKLGLAALAQLMASAGGKIGNKAKAVRTLLDDAGASLGNKTKAVRTLFDDAGASLGKRVESGKKTVQELYAKGMEGGKTIRKDVIGTPSENTEEIADFVIKNFKPGGSDTAMKLKYLLNNALPYGLTGAGAGGAAGGFQDADSDLERLQNILTGAAEGGMAGLGINAANRARKLLQNQGLVSVLNSGLGIQHNLKNLSGRDDAARYIHKMTPLVF